MTIVMTDLKLKRQGTGTNPTALVLKLGDPTKGNLRHTQFEPPLLEGEGIPI